MNKRWIGVILGPLFYAIVLLFVHPEDMSIEANAILAATVWMAIWWVTEAVPIAITALLPLVLFPLSGAMDIKTAGASYGHPIIFLFVGGFMIATAIERWNLHRRVALSIIAKVGSRPKSIVLGFMIATALLSMWISNTATTIMMVPIALAIVRQLASEEDKNNTFAKALLLGIAYAASIGGIATLIGTPTNVIFSGVVQDQYGQEISFATWMLFATPVAIFLLGICWFYLVNIGFDLKKYDGDDSSDKGMAQIRAYQAELGPMSYEERWVITIFALVAFSWMTRSFLLNSLIPNITDTIIALIGTMTLFVIPTKASRLPKSPIDAAMDEVDDSPATILDWETAVKIPWGVILLFGGGLSLASAFNASGLASWIGGNVVLLGNLPLFLLLFILIAAVNFLTEITSNIATVSMILPILTSLAFSIGIHPYILMIGATCAASCAFMLPVATAPNAIVFGSKFIKIGDMMRAGVWLNIISILTFSVYVYYVMPLVWGIDINSFPEALLK
ncbi:MAG: SLC13/DASS family transporter [Aureispira sp.]|nr:SLC13/DASS family transporter [Aureispira sp.]